MEFTYLGEYTLANTFFITSFLSFMVDKKMYVAQEFVCGLHECFDILWRIHRKPEDIAAIIISFC